MIKVEGLSKQYRLGQVGRKTLHEDINRWFHTLAGKPDPYLQVDKTKDNIQNSSADYIWALRDINIQIKQGEVLGIIGRNGAGKSTLLKILSKVTAPTTGKIKIKGRIASLLEVGTGFHPDLTGRDNVLLNGAILGMTKKEILKKFDEIVEFSGVELYIDTPVKRYSSGMYVRLAFAVAAHLEPDILIVDEVLAVGDADFQKKCLGKMRDVSVRDGRTVLFVSHNLPSVQNICTHAMVLQYGKNIFFGATADAIDIYLDHKKNYAEKNLSTRKDRKGNGFVQCTGITILNNKFLPVESVKSGDDVNIQIHYVVKSDAVRSVAFRIQVLDSNEQPLFICNNAHTTGLFAILQNEGSAICSIPKLPLYGGTYYINIHLYSANNAVLDQVEFAKELTVADGDFFGTGKIPVVKKGILVSHNWQLTDGQ